MALKPLLIGHGQARHADATHENQRTLGGQSDQAAVQFLSVQLALNRCSTMSGRFRRWLIRESG
jgi:hypothetical protein